MASIPLIGTVLMLTFDESKVFDSPACALTAHDRTRNREKNAIRDVCVLTVLLTIFLLEPI